MFIGLRYDATKKSIINEYDVVIAPNISNARFAFQLMNCCGELERYLRATPFVREAIQCGFVYVEKYGPIRVEKK